MAEWSKANDSKSFEGQPSVGSNPTLSVSQSRRGNIGRTSVLFVLIGGKINEITVHFSIK